MAMIGFIAMADDLVRNRFLKGSLCYKIITVSFGKLQKVKYVNDQIRFIY